MTFQKRISEYANPSHSEWRGQSTQENIDRWSKRAEKESDGARHRASTAKEPTLPPTGEVRTHSTHQRAGTSEDFYERAKADLNGGKLASYMPGVRRIGK
jgi:hypothetical protein